MLLFAGICIFVWKIRDIADTAVLPLNFVALALIVIPLAQITMYEGRRTYFQHLPASDTGSRITHVTAPKDAPNIYHIVLDAYGRDDVLKTRYNYDNSAFIAALKARGFFVATQARTNYCQTRLSLASMLNLNYLDRLNPDLAKWGNDDTPMATLIGNNKAARYLKARGYRLVSSKTGIDYPYETHLFELYKAGTIERTPVNQFQQLLYGLTPMPTVQSLVCPPPPTPTINSMETIAEQTPEGLVGPRGYEIQRQRVLRGFAMLEHVRDKVAPLYVFVRIVAPHPPYVFHTDGSLRVTDRPYMMADGSDFTAWGGTRDEYRQGYRDQIQYINQRTLAAIDAILAHSTRRTIIILQADHGPGSTLDWKDPEKTDMKERMAILLSYRFPDKAGPSFPDTATPINSYRAIFSYYFGEKLQRLPEISYFSLWEKPYQYMEVDTRTEPWHVIEGNQTKK